MGATLQAHGGTLQAHTFCCAFLQVGGSKKAGMTADQVAIIARLKANNAQLNLRPELRGQSLVARH